MSASRRTVAASRFKAECLAILDEVEETREAIIVTKRGRAVAKVVPLEDVDRTDAPLRGSVTFHGDIVAPSGERWNADE